MYFVLLEILSVHRVFSSYSSFCFRHKAIVKKFLALNLDNEDPQAFLRDLLENFDDE